MATQFYLTLPSNSSMAYFPNNTVANFRVRLAETIVLPGQWEVALAGLHYPHTWTTLRRGVQQTFLYKIGYEQYSDAEEFDGVTLEELPELEKLFELNIYVYRLVELHDENEDKTEIVAQLTQRSHRTYDNSMYLNLYGSHFSYIKNLRMYCKSYCCCKCDKLWKTAKALNQHERTCEATIRHVFPGGAYKVPQTIFDLLEDEGIQIPEDLKYFPYRATFDFECYFQKETQHPRNTTKLGS